MRAVNQAKSKSIHQLAWAELVEVRLWDKCMNAWYVPGSAHLVCATTLIFKTSQSPDA
jgi:hypothetical protein